MPTWLGEGVITVDGIDIQYGEEIPVPKNPEKAAAFEKRINDLTGKGMVGDPPKAVSYNEEIRKLKAVIEKLEAEIKSLNDSLTDKKRGKQK